MKRLKRFFKYKLKYFIAVTLILSLFLLGSFASSASSFVIYRGTDEPDEEFNFISSAPVSIDFVIPVNNAVYDENGDLLSRNYYNLSASINPIVHLNAFDPLLYTQINDDLPSDFFWRGFASPVSSNLELFDFADDFYNDYKFIGDCQFNFSSLKFSHVSNSVDDSSSYNVRDPKLILRDFYVWNHDFDYRITTNSEINFALGSEEDNQNRVHIESLEFFYSIPGDSTINSVTVQGSDFLNNSFYDPFYNVVLSPSVLGVSDSDSVVYIHQCIISFSDLYNLSVFSFPDLSVTYTFNPFLDNYFIPAPDVPDVPVDPDDPVISLTRYTEWIGDALGGFLDFNIFPGYTLGGIFMTVLAFSCVVWFLKLVAGG